MTGVDWVAVVVGVLVASGGFFAYMAVWAWWRRCGERYAPLFEPTDEEQWEAELAVGTDAETLSKILNGRNT